MATTLPCENGGGSLNNPDASDAQTGLNNDALASYVPTDTCVGTWEISSLDPDACATNDQIRQESYVAETLNIAGAPVNVYKLLGIHEQGNGSLLTSATLISSSVYPGYPLSGVNTGGAWRSLAAGAAVATSGAFIGADFGIKRIWTGDSEYAPNKQKWTLVAALQITQANTPNEYARQVRVEIADGSVEMGSPQFIGTGDGVLSELSFGVNATQSSVTLMAITPMSFTVYVNLPDGTSLSLGSATTGVPFRSTAVNFLVTDGLTPFDIGDTFIIPISYVWKRAGVYNLIQSPLPQTLNLQSALRVKAIRVAPTLFSGTGQWEVSALDVLDSVPTDINNIQDLFFNENRDRDYGLEPILLKAQYTASDSIMDLSKFGLNILDQYSFTVSFAAMVQALGRPIVTGDIVEVIPEMQYDHNLKPIRKFVEVTDTGWAAEGYSTAWKPTVYRFAAQPALPSQETRDIFGTLDTQKYLVADSIFSNGIGQQLDTTPLTQMEEIIKAAADAVPETGSDDQRTTIGQPLPPVLTPINIAGQPPAAQHHGKQGLYIEDGLPKNGEPYGEGFVLPDMAGLADGTYFRLNYASSTNIPARLFRYSLVKHRWIYQETDRRGDYSSHKPSIRNILQSDTKAGLGKKQT